MLMFPEVDAPDGMYGSASCACALSRPRTTCTVLQCGCGAALVNCAGHVVCRIRGNKPQRTAVPEPVAPWPPQARRHVEDLDKSPGR
jgi:hypothetical protein